MSDFRIIELGADLGDDRSLALHARITFRDKIPVFATGPGIKLAVDDLIGTAKNCRIEDGFIAGDILLTNGEDELSYRYHPDFRDTMWHSLDSNPPQVFLESGELVALYAAPSSR